MVDLPSNLPWLLRLLSILGLLGLLASTAGCGGNDGETETYEFEIGYQGEAKTNPFLAAQRLCEEYGYRVTTEHSIVDLPSTGTTLILPAEALSSPASAQTVADWVSDGGSLIYLLEGGSGARNESSEFSVEEKGDGEEINDYLLTIFEVTASTAGLPTSQVSVFNREFEVEIRGNTNFHAHWAFELHDSRILQGQFSEFSYGDGLVYLISDAHPLRNRQIGEHDHAAFFWAMIESCKYTDILFVEGRQFSFMALLWSRAWMVIVPILIALVFWIWKNLPRHGPMRPDEVISEREFAKHVDALGHFLWRHLAISELLAPIRRRVTTRFHSALDDEHLESLSERTGIPIERIQQALHTEPGKEPANFVQISRDLQTLDSSL